jgi:hypothetical protein
VDGEVFVCGMRVLGYPSKTRRPVVIFPPQSLYLWSAQDV